MEFLALGIPLILPNRDYMHSLITTVYWSRLANRSVWSLSWKRRFLQLVPEDWEAFELGASNKSLKMTAAWRACFEHFFTSCQHELVHRLTVNMISGWFIIIIILHQPLGFVPYLGNNKLCPWWKHAGPCGILVAAHWICKAAHGENIWLPFASLHRVRTAVMEEWGPDWKSVWLVSGRTCRLKSGPVQEDSGKSSKLQQF